ncbi:ABC transporter ATP-binding protein [Pseudoroseicyclus aestuarii]|uniref:Carbohydrate ABC transporter ATP-binding protein (CUT1 family) n=1 Tax=Pseudoroseicyclus aestuarii TaxID=1795041 RepID=A0A318SNN6_9RHOB|nr:sn-glycerol-3-phosphate ABC transporter ATP-binding protein UgpC [Pseudoroseicyclus aestuarii]PYE82444.1 carbohydrate ABC transporter ATP-binding protein (CUT1 family) [Pseudoroseicyclus aestuarii]
MADLALKGVRKAFGGLEVIKGVDLDIRDGEFVVFVGPSGCGKSTLLRMIAGLETVTGGEVSIGGKVMNGVPAPRRGISMVFQSYALYPHMSVRENMSFGLQIAGMDKAETTRRVEAAAEILQIGDYLDRAPRALSGGQRQRVAIGRAIVREPEVFLFDEPLSNLDAALRGQTRVEIARLHARLGTTMIYVTHDQTEAMTLADRIVVLRGGRVEQVGTPLELYRAPANDFVAGFIGGHTMNFLSPEQGRALLAGTGGAVPAGAKIIGVRPEHLRLAEPGAPGLTGRIDVVEEFGEFGLYHLTLDEAPEGHREITLKSDAEGLGGEGAQITLTCRPEAIHAFDDKGAALAAGSPAGAGRADRPSEETRHVR